MSTKLPKDPIHEFEGVIIKVAGLLSTLIIVGDIAVSKFAHATWQVRIGVGGLLIAFVVWLLLKRKDKDNNSGDSP